MKFSMRTAALCSCFCLGCGTSDGSDNNDAMGATDLSDDAAASSSGSPNGGSAAGSMLPPSTSQVGGEGAGSSTDTVAGAVPNSDSANSDSANSGSASSGSANSDSPPGADSADSDSVVTLPTGSDTATGDSEGDDSTSGDGAGAMLDDPADPSAVADDTTAPVDDSGMDPAVMDPAGDAAPPATSAGSAGSAGCASTSPLSSGTFTLDVEGTERSFVLDVPDGYDASSPYRLVFVWHPLGGSAEQVVRGNYDGLEPLANGQAIFVAPDGLVGMAAGINGQGWYNTDGGDMAFLRAMLAHLNENLCVDPARIFSTGFSFGGMMSYAIGCEMADVFRAIAPSSGNSVASGCNQSTDHPVAVLGLHGDADDFVATSGGRSARDLFVERNDCSTTTEPSAPEPCIAYQGCDEGYPVVWCEYPGEHRPWSEAPQVIWDFFSRF